MAVQTDIIDTYAEFKRLRRQWDLLYLQDPEAQFFLSWEWLSLTFLRDRHRKFFILAVRLEASDSNYIAFLPLRLSVRKSPDNQGFHNELYMAGNYWSDYTGFLCDPLHERAASDAFAAQLKCMHWTKLHLDYVRQSPKRLNCLLSGFQNDAFSVERKSRLSEIDNVNGLVCPYVDLPKSFETYLGSQMRPKSRQKMRRFLRRVEHSPELRITQTSIETSERDIQILVQLWAKKWRDRKGEKTDRLAGTLAEILHQSLQADILYMPMLWSGERPLGGFGSLIDARRKSLLFFVGAREVDDNDVPSGFILHGHSIKWAIENGLGVYDFLSGNESYKYSFCSQEKNLECVVVSVKSRENLNDKLDPWSIDDVLELSRHALRRGKHARAENGFLQVLKARPDCVEAMQRLAVLYTEQGDTSRANEMLGKLAAL